MIIRNRRDLADAAELIRATDHFQSGTVTHRLKETMLSVDLAILGPAFAAGALSERRIALMMDTNLSGLPPFLVEDGGVNSGFTNLTMISPVLLSRVAQP